MGQQYGGKEGDCPVTEDISDHLLRLPFFNSMTDEQQEAVIEALLEFDAW
jgi:dTDP-4-amino-4,6-dideoxygalactose transaminase